MKASDYTSRWISNFFERDTRALWLVRLFEGLTGQGRTGLAGVARVHSCRNASTGSMRAAEHAER
jgi:hypothetical protein